MAKEKFLLVNLKDDQTKKLAQAIQNDSCRQILEYLADKEGTESDIATQLSQPLSTVHYNLQLLMKAGLVKVEEYHYSPKGREVNHYKLANQFIIIAPQGSSAFNLKEKLKSLLPAGLIAIMGGALYQLYHSFSKGVYLATNIQSPLVETMSYGENSAGAEVSSKAVDTAMQTAASTISDNVTPSAVAAVAPDNVQAAGRAMMKTAIDNSTQIMSGSAPQASNLGADQASNVTQQVATSAANNYDSLAQSTQPVQYVQPHEPNYLLWISIGVIATIALILIIQYIQYKRSARRD